jgi:hypothetical protein
LEARARGGVDVLNFSYNWYFHFLGVQLGSSLPATLLFPISGVFGDFALSGHVAHGGCKPVTNFDKAYHNGTFLTKFGMDVGSAVNAATVIRYLNLVPNLDQDAILEAAFSGGRYPVRDVVDGNRVDDEKLYAAVGLKESSQHRSAYCEFEVDTSGQKVFSRVTVDKFDLEYGGSGVRLEMADGFYFPTLPVSPRHIQVRTKDTVLGDLVPKEVWERPSYQQVFQDWVPISFLKSNNSESMHRSVHPVKDTIQYSLSPAYGRVYPSIRHFYLSCPNVLDAALTARFLIDCVAPVLESLADEASPAL